jgi:hypothetical protein
VIFADINPGYLQRLAERLNGRSALRCEVVVDDVEVSGLAATFALVIGVLLLEHVDWRKALSTISRLSNEKAFVIIQENSSDAARSLLEPAAALSQSHPIPGTMNIFREVHPILIPRSDLVTAFAHHGFACTYFAEQLLPDRKKMLALGFSKNPQTLIALAPRAFFGET